MEHLPLSQTGFCTNCCYVILCKNFSQHDEGQGGDHHWSKFRNWGWNCPTHGQPRLQVGKDVYMNLYLSLDFN